jgi:hypothetical protein
MLSMLVVVFVGLGKSFAQEESIDRFLGHWVCINSDDGFEHTISKIQNGYTLYAKNKHSERALVLTGEKEVSYDGALKVETVGSLECKGDTLFLNATMIESTIEAMDKNNQTSFEAKYTFVTDTMMQVEYTSRFEIFKNGVTKFISKKGTGFCLPSLDSYATNR